MKPTSLAMTAAKVLVSGAFTFAEVAETLLRLRGGRGTKKLVALARRLVRVLGEGRRPRVRVVAVVFEGVGFAQ